MLEGLVQEAIMYAGQQVLAVVPKEQFDKYNNYGLPQAARKLRMEPRQGGSVAKAQGCIAPWLRKEIQNQPAVIISDAARWTLNGFSKGYARKLNDAGMLSDTPEQNLYSLVMEALESFVMWFDIAQQQSSDIGDKNYATLPNGRRYLTSRVQRD
jgi:hypothetical protein